MNYKNEAKANDTRVLVGQPINYPYEFLLKIKDFLKLRSEVKKAYLACIQYPNPRLQPILLIGLEVSENFEKIIIDLEKHLSTEKKLDEKVEFVDVPVSQFKEYFSKISPFYTCK